MSFTSSERDGGSCAAASLRGRKKKFVEHISSPLGLSLSHSAAHASDPRFGWGH